MVLPDCMKPTGSATTLFYAIIAEEYYGQLEDYYGEINTNDGTIHKNKGRI